MVGCEQAVAKVIQTFLAKNDYNVTACDSVEQGVLLLRSEEFILIIVDVHLLGMSSFNLIHDNESTAGHSPIILLADYSTVDLAKDAMKHGVVDYITKPLKLQNLLNVINKATAKREIRHKKINPLKEIKTHFGTIIGESPEISHICSLIERVAPTDATVLIQGESGTGKELVAQAIHNESKRAKENFIPLNCAAIPEQLLESELFGHIKGAFTGASEKRDGLFIAANNGTVFLDEINSMNLNIQSKLLRVLQEKQVKRVGDDKPVSVNVRIIAACNESLIDKKNSGEFREDLFYRICIVPIEVPPLRRRIEDIPMLVEHFCRMESEKLDRKITLSESIIQGFLSYSWPGNIRELQNAISCSSVLSETGKISKHDLPPHIAKLIRDDSYGGKSGGSKNRTLKSYMRRMEKDYINQMLSECGGNRTNTAKLLGISRASLYRKLDQD